jgi:ribose-phosphate pyrophosphokinase
VSPNDNDINTTEMSAGLAAAAAAVAAAAAPTPTDGNKLKIIAGNSNPDLALSIAAHLGEKLCDAVVGRFANGEVSIKVLQSVRGNDVFIVQPTCGNDATDTNVNTAIMELLLLINTLRLASARRITAVIPHYGYARQDRKTRSRVPISASAVAKMITEVGVDAVVTVDLHCGQIQGFFHQTPVIDLNPASSFAEYASNKKFDLSKLVVVAPDAGAVTRARKLADKIKAAHIVTILKRRAKAGVVEEMQLVGEVNGCECIIVDDMIDTGGTLVKAAELLAANGATAVHAYATHGIFTDPACERIKACDALVEIVATDSLPQALNMQKMGPKLKVIPLAPLLSEAIMRIHTEESMESNGGQTSTAVLNSKKARAAMGIAGGHNNVGWASVEADIDEAIHVEEDDDVRQFPN